MFERGVIHCFKCLSWDYKTNQPFKFSKRIIVDRLIDSWSYPNSGSTNAIDDLIRVFHLLEGKPEPDHRAGFYHTLSTALKQGTQPLETEYFSVRWYKKGTGHFTFKQLDLVEKLNEILAKHYPNALANELRT